jgi:hypothetical protein
VEGHSHISKVVEWGFDKDHNFKATKYGCVLCDESQEKPFEYEDIEIDHTACDDDCFGCKAKGLQLATGDAAGNIIASGTTQKKWDKELQFYRDAKSQGVQPAGTSTKAIRSALEASEVLEKPYNASKMPATQNITKETVAVMKEIGQV